MREPFDSNAYYHVYNRGVDKRVIFFGEEDFRRFYESMYLFSDRRYVHAGGWSIEKDMLLSGAEVYALDREPLVSVIAYCLKSNHFHLLMRQHVPDGISRFLHRLGMGYANYFNLKYERSGRLWEGPFKAKPVDTLEHLQLLPRYIHLNALDGTDTRWRDSDGETDWVRATEVLRAYPWSSHHLYAGRAQRFPLLDESVIRAWFPTAADYEAYLCLPRAYGQEELTFTRLYTGSKSRLEHRKH